MIVDFLLNNFINKGSKGVVDMEYTDITNESPCVVPSCNNYFPPTIYKRARML